MKRTESEMDPRTTISTRPILKKRRRKWNKTSYDKKPAGKVKRQSISIEKVPKKRAMPASKFSHKDLQPPKKRRAVPEDLTTTVDFGAVREASVQSSRLRQKFKEMNIGTQTQDRLVSSRKREKREKIKEEPNIARVKEDSTNEKSSHTFRNKLLDESDLSDNKIKECFRYVFKKLQSIERH